MRSIACFLLAACSTADPEVFEVEGVPFEEALAATETGDPVVAPRTPLLMVLDGDLVAGQVATFYVINLVPGETVHVGYSLRGLGAGPCPPQMGGQCLDLVAPVNLLGTAQANAFGVAILTPVVPRDVPDGTAVSLQAVVLRGAGGVQTVTSPAFTAIVEGIPVASHSGGPPNNGFDPRYVYWTFQFGYDRATNEVHSVQTPYGIQPPTIDVNLGVSEWAATGLDFARTDLYCTVSLLLAPSPVPNWVLADPTLWFGVDHSAGGATSCNTPGHELDPAVWGADPVAALSSLGGWGVAIGDPSLDVQDVIAQLAAAQQPYAFGGVLRTGVLGPGGSTDSMLSTAFAVNPATFELLVDRSGGLTALTALQADQPGSPAPAWYNGDDIYYWSLY